MLFFDPELIHRESELQNIDVPGLCSHWLTLAQLDLSEDVVKEDKPVEVTFTYSVQWRQADTPYEKRMDKYRRYQFLPQHLEASRQLPTHWQAHAADMAIWDVKTALLSCPSWTIHTIWFWEMGILTEAKNASGP